MQRARVPLVVTGVTAVVTCGLLAAALAWGWLGPDVGRGSAFCEAARDWVVRQPANTFSNLGFVVAGLLIAWHASRPGALGSTLAARRHLPTFMACVVVFLGPASAAMHASQSALGGRLDMLSMYLVASLAAAYALTRLLRAGTATFVTVFLAGVLLCEVVETIGGKVPVVQSAGNTAFGSLLLFAIAVEVVLMRRRETVIRRGYAFASVGALLLAFIIWNATNYWGMCAPHSLAQGHAVWHLLDALAAYLLYRYYASEQTSEQTPDHAPATDRGPTVTVPAPISDQAG